MQIANATLTRWALGLSSAALLGLGLRSGYKALVAKPALPPPAPLASVTKEEVLAIISRVMTEHLAQQPAVAAVALTVADKREIADLVLDSAEPRLSGMVAKIVFDAMKGKIGASTAEDPEKRI